AFDHGEGAGADEQIATYDAHRPAAPAQLDAAGVGQLLPARRVRAHVSLPGPVRLAAGHGVLRKRHVGITWKVLYRRWLTGRPGHRPAEGKVVLFLCQKVAVTRYRSRGDKLPTPCASIPAADR